MTCTKLLVMLYAPPPPAAAAAANAVSSPPGADSSACDGGIALELCAATSLLLPISRRFSVCRCEDEDGLLCVEVRSAI